MDDQAGIEYQGYEPPPPPKHSGLGIASFVVALVSALIFVASVALLGRLTNAEREVLDEESPVVVGMIGGILLSGGLNFVALALGMVAMAEPNRQKAFAVLGMGFAILGWLALGALFVMMVGLD